MRKILFLGKDEPDYQSDALFHGMRLLFGPECVDFPRFDHMYRNGPRARYGCGFTLFNLLPDEVIDRDDLPAKIARGFFSAVIVGGDWCSKAAAFPFMDVVLKHMSPGRIFFIDGADDTGISTWARRGLYFKRENTGEGLAINFAIPEEKIICGTWPRKRKMALYEPGQPYLYETEQDYLDGYREADFAYTRRKAGWDCLRHYEIISTGCIPIFERAMHMPPETCVTLPRAALLKVLEDRGWETMSDEQIAVVGEQFHKWCKAYCTTEALAAYVLSHAPRDMSVAV